jgi:mono/diheme cytochrome c family protein
MIESGRRRLPVLALATMLAAAWAATAEAVDLANGKKVYADKCLRCHGASGKGDGPVAETLSTKLADYTDKKKMAGFTDAQLKKVTLEGKQPMPAYKGKIRDKDLDDVVAYIRTFAK